MYRLCSQVLANILVPEEQFGCILGRSTIHQLLRLMEYITSGLELKWSTVAFFLDTSKAYDSTWHTGLIYKFIQMNLSGELIRVIDSFIAHRSFRVKMCQDGDRCLQVFRRDLRYLRCCSNRTLCLRR